MQTLRIHRAPVLTLWAAVAAERLGFDPDEALTLGKPVAGLTAQSKGQRLGILTPSPEAVRRARAKRATASGVFPVVLMGRAIPVLQTSDGLRPVGKDQKPFSTASVEKYLASKFGEALPAARHAMEELARSRRPAALGEQAFGLYEKFRPAVPDGDADWGAQGVLSLVKIERISRHT
jgi:hypothetical protein